MSNAAFKDYFLKPEIQNYCKWWKLSHLKGREKMKTGKEHLKAYYVLQCSFFFLIEAVFIVLKQGILFFSLKMYTLNFIIWADCFCFVKVLVMLFKAKESRPMFLSQEYNTVNLCLRSDFDKKQLRFSRLTAYL